LRVSVTFFLHGNVTIRGVLPRFAGAENISRVAMAIVMRTLANMSGEDSLAW
jgi:hypothetical protein